MKIVTWLEREEDLPHLPPGTEALLSPRPLSRFGKLSLRDCHRLGKLARERGLRPVLEWDILMKESVLARLEREVLPAIDQKAFDSIRVQDPGALEYAREKNWDIQLILENGNHNLRAIQSWSDLAGPKLSRVALSGELTESVLTSYLPRLPVPAEILGIGRILLLYTPRHLLAPLGLAGREVRADSLEGKHKNLPALENEHGTFLFNAKDRCVLPAAGRLADAGLGALRLDLRFPKGAALLDRLSPLLGQEDALTRAQQFWPAKLIPGFFRTNKSDVFFKHLKNRRIDTAEAGYAGEVVDAQKGSHLGILIRAGSLRVNSQVRLLNPEGKGKRIQLKELRDSMFANIERAGPGEVVFIPHVGGAPVGTGVFLEP